MEFKRRPENSQGQFNFSTMGIITFLTLLFFCSVNLYARPLGKKQAEKAVRGWLKADARPLGISLGRQVKKIDTFPDDGGEPMYYVVYLQPIGFVIVPADDLVEPIICFSQGRTYNPSDDNPLGALVSRDVPARIAAARALDTIARGGQTKAIVSDEISLRKAASKAQGKWSELRSYNNVSIDLMGFTGISEVWVSPLVQSTWGQTTVGSYIGGISCYNYYTPPFNTPDGDPYNHPTGCVAAAMAQLMRYHEYPSWGPSGTYVWSNMPLQPDDSITLAEQQAIGHLCFDAAESIDTTYGSGGSSASLVDAARELRDRFGYSNSIHGYNNYVNIGAALNGMINPNLDANHPVLLGVHSPGAHAVVCDGYGFDSSTLYHHLNMGWSGHDNVWYNLPTIVCNETGYQYNIVDTCVYNIFTSGSGEIISGRITDPGGVPISGASVTATGGHEATSNSEGIYALSKIPSGTAFTISVDKGDWDFPSQNISTGTSSQNTTTCGNRWGINFTGTISAGFIELNKENYAAAETIAIRLVDSDLEGNGTQNVVVKICGGDIETVMLSENPAGSGVFTGTIATAVETFIAEDGTIQVLDSEMIIAVYEDGDDGTGSPATARNTAIVIGQPVVIYETDFTDPPEGWYIIDGGSSYDSWSPATEGGDRTSPYWTGTFSIVDSDWAGYQVMDEELISCSIDCSAYQNVTLKFNHYFNYWEGGWNEICDVDVCVDNGDWQNVERYQGADAEGQVELPLSAYGADGDPNVRIRWHYYNAYFEYWWGIDDVQITGILPPQTLGDFEPDCDVDFSDFAILSSAWQSDPTDDNWNLACDIYPPNDGIIDILDIRIFAENWLESMQ